jgi:arylsulfatase A-like enzyme
VLEIMGAEIPSRVQGKSLLPAVKKQTIPGRSYTVSAHPFINGGEWMKSVDGVNRMTAEDSAATVTTAEWTLLYDTEAGRSELYNITSDPKQLRNIIKEQPDKAHELHQLLVKYMRETKLAERLLKPRLELRF